jgi:hypothetical protein
MIADATLADFACPAGHRFRAKKVSWMNCIARNCIEDARPIGSVKQPRVKPAPHWAGVDVFGQPIPANAAAQAIADGEAREPARRRASRDPN